VVVLAGMVARAAKVAWVALVGRVVSASLWTSARTWAVKAAEGGAAVMPVAAEVEQVALALIFLSQTQMD